MFKNYLKIAFRNLKRYKVYSYINVFGLAIGIACCILILLYIQDELSYDAFHEKSGRIYRINTDVKFGSTELALPVASDMMGPILKNDYPEIEEYTRVYSFNSQAFVKKGAGYISETGFAHVDSTFFRVFTFLVLSGNTSNVLNQPNTIVINRSMALKYFGTIHAIGKFIEIKGYNDFYKVQAVIEDMPANSHFRFNFLLPMSNLSYDWGNFVSLNFHTYLILRDGVNYKEFEKNFTTYNTKYAFPFAKKFMNIQSEEQFRKAGNKIEHTLIPLTDIHLYSKRIQEISPSGNVQYVYIFSAVAVFILLIACINFMNLTTARYANRAREVGIRKVLGSIRKNLVLQFLTESVFVSLISVVLALVLVYHSLPFFTDLALKELSFTNVTSPGIIIFLIALPFIVGVLAGSYPAFFLSRFMPQEILKGKLQKGSKGGSLRRALVVFQFASSIILITGTIIIYSQLNYIRTKNLGYQKDQILIINDAYNLGNNVEAFKNELMKEPGIAASTVSGFLPIPSARNFTAFSKDISTMSQSGFTMQQWKIDYDYLPTLGIKVVNGRNFSKDFGSDSSAIILNESAAKKLGFADPVGEKIYTFNKRDIVGYTVIGVVKDFHFESMHQDIGGLALLLGNDAGRIAFRVNAASVSSIIKAAEEKWKSLAAGMPFNFSFMDESFDQVYKAEERIGIIALSFSLLAIIVACLGLFGLATFLAEQRTKEIGVRKVLGASLTSILLMLSVDYLKWVAIANLIALPAAYFIMQIWLQDFAYRVSVSWWIFAAAGVAALIIALFTVSFQAIRAASANPVESLKYE